jgi:hypothetical protein
MTAPESNWKAVSERVEALGSKLKTHLAQSETGDVAGALETLGRAVREAFDAAGNAMRDDAVRTDVREVGRLLADAVSATFNRAKADVTGTPPADTGTPPADTGTPPPDTGTPPADAGPQDKPSTEDGEDRT